MTKIILLDFPSPEEAGEEIYPPQGIFVKLDIMYLFCLCGGACVANVGK